MRILIPLYLLLTCIVCVGQRRPIEINGPVDKTCGDVSLGSGFGKSGMVQYVARPKIIESRWEGNTLYIKTSVVAECCPPDYLGYAINSDTLVLYYGIKQNMPAKNGRNKEFLICTCGHNGCCYEFEYKIPKLNSGKNYLVATLNVSSFGLEPYVINYLNSQLKSFYYQNCNDLTLCLTERINASIETYKKLRPLYDQLLTELQTENEQKTKTVDKIRSIWIEYFSLENAIADVYVKTNMNHKVYTDVVSDQKLQIQAELIELDKLLSETSKYMSGGAFIEKIIYKKE